MTPTLASSSKINEYRILMRCVRGSQTLTPCVPSGLYPQNTMGRAVGSILLLCGLESLSSQTQHLHPKRRIFDRSGGFP